MNNLNESQADLIVQWVKSHHLTIHSLENEFIDHICCDVEALMAEGKSFKTAFNFSQMKLGDNVLNGLEKQTILQLTYNQRVMKFMTKLTGIIVLFSFFAAIISNVIGLDYWKTLMAGGMIVLSIGFAPLFFIEHYRQQETGSQKILHIFGFLAAFLIPLAAFLGLFNSPNAVKLLAVGLIFLVFGFIPLSIISIKKDTTRTALSGSIIILLFFVLLSIGFTGLKISKDRINSWLFISDATKESSSLLNDLNQSYFIQLKNDTLLTGKAIEIVEKSDILVQKMSGFRDNFIMEVDPSFKEGKVFFQNIDNHFVGQKYLINSNATDVLLNEIEEYKNLILSILTDENELIKQNIASLLKNDAQDVSQDLNSQKNFLFRDFPAITDVALINSMIVNVRVVEYQTLHYLTVKSSIKN